MVVNLINFYKRFRVRLIMEKLIIFDLDNTLYGASEDYIRSGKEFIDFAKGTLSLDKTDNEIRDVYEDIQKDIIEKDGFDSYCFPKALKLAYSKLVGNNSPRTDYLSWVAYNIGMSVLDENLWKRKGLSFGVKETLDFLATDLDNQFAMVTFGAKEIQEKKIKALGLEDMFNYSNTYIEKFSKLGAIKELSRDRDLSKVYFVGDSWNGDMVPALKAKVNPIYIPDNVVWGVSGIPDERINLVKKISDITELKTNYDEIF